MNIPEKQKHTLFSSETLILRAFPKITFKHYHMAGRLLTLMCRLKKMVHSEKDEWIVFLLLIYLVCLNCGVSNIGLTMTVCKVEGIST